MKPIWFLGVAAVAGVMVAAGTVYQAAAADTLAAPVGMQADAGPDRGPGWGPPGPPGDHGPGMRHGGPGDRDHGGWHHHDDMLGLFARSQDKALTLADVKVIAQAILLEHGQHDWTVTNVAAANGAIDFSYATPHGDVVATFAVDPKTGHMKRTG